MAATQSVTLTAAPPDRLADSLGLDPGDRQAGDVLVLSNSDALALIRAGVAQYTDRTGTPPTSPAGAPVTVEPDPLLLDGEQATRDATAAMLAIFQQRSSSLGGAHLVSGSQQRWREEFLNLDDWLVSTTGGANAPTYSLTNGVLSVVSGTTAGAELVLMSKRRFSAPVKLATSFAMTQKIANHVFLMEFVADDDTDPVTVDDTVVAGWRFSGSDNTTATGGRYEVLNGVGARQGVTVTTLADHVGTSPKAVAEVQLESDETRWYTRVLNSANGRSSGNVRQDVSPDPSRLYRVRLRWTNLATAPASSTTTTISSVVVTDYTELNVEVTGSRGATTQDEALGVNVANQPNVSVANNPALNVNAVDSLVTTTALAANANTAHTAADEGTNAVIRGNRVRIGVQATAAALGALMHIALEESEDGTTYRESWRTPVPIDGAMHSFDVSLRARYWRMRSINGATAHTAYFLKVRSVRFDGAADIDKTLTFPLTPGAGAALVTAANGTYVSAVLDLGANHLWERFRVLATSDQASATGGFYVQQSIDNSNWLTTASNTLAAGVPLPLETPIIGRYLRIGITNGATAATLQRLIATLVSL